MKVAMVSQEELCPKKESREEMCQTKEGREEIEWKLLY